MTKTATNDDFIQPRKSGRILCGMEHHAPRKYRGPETWALVRDAYLSGEPAKLVCERFDVSYANLRAKASREGWTRRAYAGATDVSGVRRSFSSAVAAPPPASATESGRMLGSPKDALQAGMARASEALAAGRAQEATAILKATETFARLNGQDVARAAKEADKDPEEEEKTLVAFMEAIWERAEHLARAMMSDDRAHIHPAWASRNIFAWRAEHFGPEVAAADYDHARSQGLHHGIWDENGVIVPPTPAGQLPAHMRSLCDHYGPNKKRKHPAGTEDRF